MTARVATTTQATLLAALLAACSMQGPQTFPAVFPPEAGGDVVLLTIFDTTGQLRAVDVVQGVAMPEDQDAAPLNSDPAAVVVAWTGSRCDLRYDLRLDQRAGVFTLAGSASQDARGCGLAGVSRSLVLRFAGAVDVERFTVAIE